MDIVIWVLTSLIIVIIGVVIYVITGSKITSIGVTWLLGILIALLASSLTDATIGGIHKHSSKITKNCYVDNVPSSKIKFI